MFCLRQHHVFLFSVMAPAIVVPGIVHAQDGEQARTLDAVVVVAERAVTATKTDTPLVKTPQAISVVPSDLFIERGARNMQETLRYSAGVNAEAYGLDTRSDGSTIRGLDPVQYLDGMRKVYNFSPLPRTEVYTLDRVEVLRGPSSVLYGQGASGGILNTVSKRPQFTQAGEVGVQIGNFQRRQVQADITGPLDDSGQLAGRFIAVARDSDMQTDHLPDDRQVLAPSITWRPGDRTEITFLGLYQRDRTASSQQFLPVVSTLHASERGSLDPSTFLGDKGYDRLDARQASGTLLAEHRFNDTVALRSALRYLDADTTFQEIYPDTYSSPLDPFIDAERRVVNRNLYAIKPHIRTLTNDNSLQFNFDTGAFNHTLLAGVDYTDFRQESSSAFCSAFSDPADCVVTPIDIYNPVSSGVVAPAYVEDPDLRNTQLGLYVQDQIRYADRVSLVLGVRRDRARSETEGSEAQTDEATTFRVGVIGEVGKGVSPYLSYSESFLPVAGVDFYGNALVPVRGRQVEGGVKWAPARGMLFTANAYRIIESNRPTNDPEHVLFSTQTGEIRSRGFELEGAYAVADDITITASYSYNKAEVTESNFPNEIGKQLNDTPQRLASLWAAKTFEVGQQASLRVGLGGRHVGSTLSTGTTHSLTTPSYTLADALVALDWSDWSLALNVNNLLDKTYFAPCRAFGDCFSGNSRTVVGTIAYRF
ncbi:iron complex outermembrane receptor protein [Luteimonas cucumeris]|uniref:Iron complex outermembrane receptor protein n=1 Tax=Luteimonas cucumeris TaxID=985012 RepID=A0A562LAD8_9GAMM|nr:TonB-dependent siderophore receptor [Luteimonas cucumeris]TWI04600.1 iron complex outermembrane receptor protein [Luteimonas cucumeris]